MTIESEAADDHGLVRALSAWGLAAAIANTMIGAGIFVLPAAMAKAVGGTAPLYYLACALAVGAVGLCFAEAGSRVAVSGGVSACVEAGLGRYAGFITALLLWLGATLAAAGIATALVDQVAIVLPVFHQLLWRDALIVALLATLALINVGGVQAGSGLVGITLLLKFVPIAVLLVVGALNLPKFAPATPPPPHADIGRAMILGIFAFMGMETALGAAGEVRRPGRNVPLGILISLGAVTVIYVAIQLVTQGLLGPALASSKTPLADAMGRVSPALSTLLLVGAAVSMLGYLSADILTAPRILFGMARDGFLPKAMAKVHPKTRTPHIAILAHIVCNILLAVTGAFAELAILSTLMVVVAYIAGCVAAVILQRRGVAREGPPLNSPLTPVAAVVGVVAMVWIAAQGKWEEGAAVAGAILVASVIYWVGMRRKA